jgi:predicted AAA+ superfamily ATPase
VVTGYLARVADDELAARMSSSGAVLIEGPKACGKTATAMRVAGTVVRLDVDPGSRALVSAAPEVLFAQPTPILFDEWQIEPRLWDLVRRQVDDRSPARGQFVLTGSASPNDDIRRHSGAGRISTLRMRPMSLYESGDSSGQVSLAALFDGTAPAAVDPGLTVARLVERIVTGGWPDLVGAEVADARQWLRDYLRNLIEVDVQNVGARRNPRNVRKLLTALGRSVGTDTSVRSLAADVGGSDGPADRGTIDAYLTTLKRLMVVEDVPAWAPHMRSATPLRQSATRYLVDPSLGVAALDDRFQGVSGHRRSGIV